MLRLIEESNPRIGETKTPRSQFTALSLKALPYGLYNLAEIKRQLFD
jgi:hypothetical protein